MGGALTFESEEVASGAICSSRVGRINAIGVVSGAEIEVDRLRVAVSRRLSNPGGGGTSIQRRLSKPPGKDLGLLSNPTELHGNGFPPASERLRLPVRRPYHRLRHLPRVGPVQSVSYRHRQEVSGRFLRERRRVLAPGEPEVAGVRSAGRASRKAVRGICLGGAAAAPRVLRGDERGLLGRVRRFLGRGET
jgi:hypothetical protein